MTGQIMYRLLTVNDAERYHRIRMECLRSHPGNFGDSYEEQLNIKATRFTKELTEKDSESFWYGAFHGNVLIGITGFIQQKRSKTKHRGDLVQVYVNPHYTHRGIGRALIKLTLDKAFNTATIEHILLSVVYSNDKAIALYKDFGFVQYGFIENYFKSNNVYSAQVFMVLSRYNSKNLHGAQKEKALNEFLQKLRTALN